MSLLIVWPHRPRRSDKLSARQVECIDAAAAPDLPETKAQSDENDASITQESPAAKSWKSWK